MYTVHVQPSLCKDERGFLQRLCWLSHSINLDRTVTLKFNVHLLKGFEGSGNVRDAAVKQD